MTITVTSPRKYTFHLLLLPLIFVLHVVNNYTGLFSGGLIGKYLLLYLLLAIILYGISLLFFRDQYRSAAYTSLLLLLFFGFGAIHDLLKKMVTSSWLVSYSFLLPFFFTLLLAVAFYIRKRKPGMVRLNYFFSILTIVYLAVECFTFSYRYITIKADPNDLGDPAKKLSTSYRPCTTCQKPDIYFIIFDEYTSSASLKEDFQYENKAIDSLLAHHNFYTVKNSNSNYDNTVFSIASTFNLDYLRMDRPSRQKLSSKLILQGEYSVKKSELIPILRKEGYAIRNYSLFHADDFPTHCKLYFDEYRKLPLYGETLVGRIKKDIAWGLPGIFVSRQQKMAAAIEQQRMDIWENFVVANINGIHKSLQEKIDSPRFVYSHVSLPHEPFFFDASGNRVPDSVVLQYANPRQSYLQQLIYTNTLLEKLVTDLMADTLRPKIIVIQGDHGFRNFEGAEYNKRFRNLNTIFFPDHDYSLLYDNITPVNTFRIILNKYFGQQLPLLKDSSIIIK